MDFIIISLENSYEIIFSSEQLTCLGGLKHVGNTMLQHVKHVGIKQLNLVHFILLLSKIILLFFRLPFLPLNLFLLLLFFNLK